MAVAMAVRSIAVRSLRTALRLGHGARKIGALPIGSMTTK